MMEPAYGTVRRYDGAGNLIGVLTPEQLQSRWKNPLVGIRGHCLATGKRRFASEADAREMGHPYQCSGCGGGWHVSRRPRGVVFNRTDDPKTRGPVPSVPAVKEKGKRSWA